MLSFEIEQREGGFYSARTDTQTEGQTDTQNHPVPHSNIDIVREYIYSEGVSYNTHREIQSESC